MSAWLDVCRFTPSAGGTTDWTYSAAVQGYQSPASANVVNGTVYSYRAESADLTQWEIGSGAYNTSTGVLSRTTIIYSSNSNAKVNFTVAPQVAIVALKEDLLSMTEANSFTSAQQEQGRANLGASVGIPDVIVEEQQASGTNGGTATSGSFATRVLNTLVRNNNSIASLASNQVTLGAGTYYFEWSAPAAFVQRHQTRVQNITASTTVGTGTSEYSSNSNSDAIVTRSFGACVVTIAGSTAFALQHEVQATKTSNGLGIACSFGTEVYSHLEITKLG